MIIFLDYDGTLVPLREFPHLAKIEPRRKEFLRNLADRHRVVIITGRDKRSFSEVFGEVPEEIHLVTSHGARLYKGERLVADFLGSTLPDLEPLRRRLRELPGTYLEEKEGCFALHFRAFRGDEEEVRRVFEEFVSLHPPVRVLRGKKILEALYGEFDKGKGVERALEVFGWRGEGILYVGDDTTDLDAFRKVKELGGRTVYVGRPPPPEADLSLGSVEEVYRFLSSLQEAV
jgi:trehalose-phosphatase